jgi:Lon protease-like protein
VLFPGAILPLHIFEPRYQRMTADALDSNGWIAMALLCPGWEKSYYERPAIEPVVCIGRIVAHERLSDGKYNFLLQGQWRAKVVDETLADASPPYRLARAVPMDHGDAMEIDLTSLRHRLLQLFTDGPLADGGLGRQFARLLASPMPTEHVADLIAFNCLEDVHLKQSLLADGDAGARIGRLVAALAEQRPPAHKSKQAASHNASMN